MKTIYTNGRIYTMNDERDVFNTMVVEDGRIVELYNTDEKLEGENILNLEGKVVYPGLNDSHLHLGYYGYYASQVDLAGTKTKKEAIERISKYIEENELKEGQWVLGWGWNHDYFEDDKSFLNKFDLDQVNTELPIAVSRACGHVLSVNSKALETAGIKNNPVQIEGGQIDIDEEGNPIGVFRENALGEIRNHIPRRTLDQVKESILLAIKEMNSWGLTSIHSDDLSSVAGYDYKEILQMFRELAEDEKLNIRIYEQCRLKVDELDEFLEAGNTTGVGNDFFKIGSLKLFLDGSLGARTAALREPYSDDPNEYGIITASEEEIDEMVGKAFDHNMQVAAHGIGDRAIETAIRCMSKNRRDDLRNGVVHCQITDSDILKSFKENEILAYVQPIFLDYDRNIVWDRVGDRTYTSYNWKTLVDLGVHVSFGTDSPVEHFNPFHNIYEAVTRKDLNGLPEEGFLIAQALSVDESLRAYTYEGAYASFEEDVKGTLEAGKFADFIILNEDLYKIDLMKIKDITVEKTIVNGKEVYSKN
ncbi:MAG: amidohydrolase [Tissierellia bacterium]|nr:amidohydrolase [Tissierellia bacterium]